MKILVWNFRQLANTGGPEGYMYNIHSYLKDNPSNKIVFYSDLLSEIKTVNRATPQPKGFVKSIIADLKHIVNLCWRYYHLPSPQIPEGFDINDYDYVHIHKVIDFYTFKRTFSNFKGKTIITTHCPCTWTDEMLSHYDKFVALFRSFILYWECKAYKDVDYLMFPCKGAREPYEKEPKLKKLFTNNEDKFFYVPSAITDISIDEKKIQKFESMGIPEGSFVISYFGRHNSIKGYDILKKVGERLLEKYPNLYFLCAGRGEIEQLKHPRWIELGFINNTHELLYQTDLYISTNRETYFDLVVLEILRSATKLILSETGGNNYFKSLPEKGKRGLEFYDINNIEQLVSIVEQNIELKTSNFEEFKSECDSNRELFLNTFTMSHFINNYINEIEKLHAL